MPLQNGAHTLIATNLNKYRKTRQSLLQETTGLVKSIGWYPLEERHLLSQVTMLYKIRKSLVNASVIPNHHSVTSKITISTLPWLHLSPAEQLYGYSFFSQNIGVWNILSPDTVTSNQVSSRDWPPYFIRGLLPPGHLKIFHCKFCI